MKTEKNRNSIHPWITAASVMLFLFFPIAVLMGQTSRLTLVNKSSGLAAPSKEEGNTELEMADINQDGHLDIVSVGDHGSPYFNSNQHGIMVWLGNGAGTWSVLQTGNFGYGGCAVGDLDWDGLPDVAWGIHHNMGTTGFGAELMGAALGNGTGSGWQPWGSGLASNGETWGMFATGLADFNGDGRLDVVSQSFGGGNGLRLYENHGDGTWSQAWALTGGSVRYTLETGDINGDGHADMVTTRSGTNVLLGNGAFGFTVNMNGLPTGSISGVDLGDMNHDGCEDMAFALGSSGVRCYRFRKSSNQWVSASSGLPVTGSYQLTQFGDLDGDSHLDIVAYGAPTGRVYLGDGMGNWIPDATWTMPSPGDASALRVDGDVDHDGREDIAVLAVKSGFPFYRNQLRVYSPYLAPAALSARITTPRGGETFRTGTVRNIRWLTAVPAAHGKAVVDILYSLTGAAGPWIPIATNLPDNGCYQWGVHASSSENSRIKIIVTTSAGTVSAQSASDFTLAGESLEADAQTLSAGTGGVVNFALDAGAFNPSRNYFLLGSASGTDPGLLLPGNMVTLPLNWDLLTDLVISLANSPALPGFHGALDASGRGTAVLDTLGSLPPTSVGTVLNFAFLLYYPAIYYPYDFVSNPVSLEILP